MSNLLPNGTPVTLVNPDPAIDLPHTMQYEIVGQSNQADGTPCYILTTPSAPGTKYVVDQTNVEPVEYEDDEQDEQDDQQNDEQEDEPTI